LALALAAVLPALSLGAVGTACATLLTNGDFESFTAGGNPATLLDGQWVHFNGSGNSGLPTPIDITGWSQIGGGGNSAGLFNPTAGDGGGQPPSQTNLLFVNNNLNAGYISQLVGQNVQSDTLYTLGFQHGARGTSNGAFSVQLLAGGTPMGSLGGTGTVGVFQPEQIAVNSTLFPATVGLPLEVRILEPDANGQTTYDDFSLTASAAPPQPDIIVIDDNMAGWSVSAGGFTNQVGVGDAFNSTHSWNQSQSPADVATYSFAGLLDGVYDVFATWRQNGQGNVGSAVYTISDGGGTVTVNQHTSAGGPAGDLILQDTDGSGMLGFRFQRLARLMVSDNTLQVDMNALGNNFILSDAVAIRLVPEPSALLIWSLLAGLGIGVGWRRRKT